MSVIDDLKGLGTKVFDDLFCLCESRLVHDEDEAAPRGGKVSQFDADNGFMVSKKIM